MPKNKENEKIMKENTTKVILNVPNKIADEYKDMAIKRGLTRSSMIIFAMSWYLDYQNQIDMNKSMIDYLNNPVVMKAVIEEIKKEN